MKYCVLLFLILGAGLSHAQPTNDLSASLREEQLDQSGTAITIIFDDSGSMAGEKLTQAKAAFLKWIAGVPEDYRLGLWALNAGKLVPMQRGNKEEIAREVAAIGINGGTPLADAIAEANKTIAERQQAFPYERQVLLIFTDGEDSTVRGNAGVVEEIQNSTRRNIEAVGIGFHGEGDYMSGAATRYFNAGNEDELLRGLAKVDSEIGDTSDIVIEPDVAESMKVVRFEPAVPAPEASTETSSVNPTHSETPWAIILVVGFLVLVVGRAFLKSLFR